MAVGPIGSVIYANQMVHAQASKQAEYQNSVEMQSVLAAALQQEQDEIVEEVRPPEESYKIDPENEHERHKNQDEQEESEKESKPHKEATLEQEEESATTTGHLDIKA